MILRHNTSIFFLTPVYQTISGLMGSDQTQSFFSRWTWVITQEYQLVNGYKTSDCSLELLQQLSSQLDWCNEYIRTLVMDGTS